MRRLSAAEIYRRGMKCLCTTTITDDFVPRRAKGSVIWGERAKSGRRLKVIDLTSGIGVNSLGYDEEMGLIPGNEWYNPHEVLLAEELCVITPGGEDFDKVVFFCNSGTEAVEAALKMCMARRYHEYMKKFGKRLAERRLAKKSVVCAFGGAFHGRSLGSLSFNCSKVPHTEGFFRDRGDLSVGMKVKRRAVPVRHLPFPEQGNAKSIAAFKAILKKHPFVDATAMFIEIVQGEGGIRPIDPECLRLLESECRKYGVYIVADEVQSGMMRTGKMFACEHYNFVPDIICLSKALSGGKIPIGAAVARAEFNFVRPGEHSNTFGGNATACKAALTTIKRLKALNKKKLAKVIAMLAEFAPEGLGLMRRIVFDTPEARDAFIEKALEHGVLAIPAGKRAVRLMPPLNITPKLLAKAIRILKRCMAG